MPSAISTAGMNTAVAVNMPACSPLRSSAGRNGASSGANICGRELAKKNSSSGPRSSTSLRPGLSCGFSCVVIVMFLDTSIAQPRDRPREILGLEGREIVDALAYADEVHGQAVFRRDRHEDAAA